MTGRLMSAKRYLKSLQSSKSVIEHEKKAFSLTKKVSLRLLRAAILVGISYIILVPVITMISRSFFTPNDIYNPVVMLIPQEGTLEVYKLVIGRMNYFTTLSHTLVNTVTLALLQLLICSIVGYGFARFQFPFKKLLFSCVILTIVVPTHTLMLPLYMTFRNFDVFGIAKLLTGNGINLLGTRIPMYIITLFGSGLRSGLYIYIFNQFFRGMPKEIEEAALVDGAGRFHTFFRIMLVNAMPPILTVTVFSLVWQYNDMFYTQIFSVNSAYVISKKLSSLASAIGHFDNINDPSQLQVYVYAGVILTLIPMIILYCVLQRRFVEGVERSGIVG